MSLPCARPRSTNWNCEPGGGRALAEPWALSTFPSPDSDIDHVRIGFYHCAGGHEITAMTNGRRRPIAVRRALIQKLASLEPDAIVANGDHMYWDLYSPRFATTYAQSEEGFAYAGTFDRTQPIFGTPNEDFVLKRRRGTDRADLSNHVPFHARVLPAGRSRLLR